MVELERRMCGRSQEICDGYAAHGCGAQVATAVPDMQGVDFAAAVLGPERVGRLRQPELGCPQRLAEPGRRGLGVFLFSDLFDRNARSSATH